MFNFEYYFFHSMEIIKINIWMGLIIDSFGFITIFITFPIMSNWLSCNLIISITSINKDMFFSKFYDDNNVD